MFIRINDTPSGSGYRNTRGLLKAALIAIYRSSYAVHFTYQFEREEVSK